MNLNHQPTTEDLARLIAARKDSLDCHILWVCEAGDVRIDKLDDHAGEAEFERCNPNMRARLKMYRRGQGYVGRKAAADKDYVGNVLKTLQQAWQEAQRQDGLKVVDRYC